MSSKESQMITSTTPEENDPICLKKYHYRFLGALERDLDSFNRLTGMPVEVIETLRRLQILAHHSPQPALFLRSPLLQDFVEFLLKIPEGLIPVYFATRIVTGRTEQAVKGHIKTLAFENYCALRTIALFIHSISFSNQIFVPFDVLDNATGICEAISPAPRDDRLKPILINIFKEPLKYFKITNKH